LHLVVLAKLAGRVQRTQIALPPPWQAVILALLAAGSKSPTHLNVALERYASALKELLGRCAVCLCVYRPACLSSCDQVRWVHYRTCLRILSSLEIRGGTVHCARHVCVCVWVVQLGASRP